MAAFAASEGQGHPRILELEKVSSKNVKSDTMDYVMHVKYSTFHRHCFDSFHHRAPAQSTGILARKEA